MNFDDENDDLEYDIEQDIVQYLTNELKTIKTTALGAVDWNDEDVLSKAEGNPNGIILVYNIQGDADTPEVKFQKYHINNTFMFDLFAKNRAGRQGIYSIRNKVRKLMIKYNYNGIKLAYRWHYHHPLPLVKGVFFAQLKFELNLFVTIE